MESRAIPSRPDLREEGAIQLLLAGGDAALRSLVAARAREVVRGVVVLEAKDGDEAMRVGLQHGAQLAVLDVEMPRLGGIEVALRFAELRPRMRIALQTADPLAHRERARACRLALFDRLELDRVIAWLELQARSFVEPHALRQAHSLVCSACGYGIAPRIPPDRCPMCQREGTWSYSPWRPFTADRRIA
jgi:CheY-like chemotaxis protein